MALIIAGDRSGSGKTTVTLAMLAYLRSQNLNVQPFKVGPDYIDPIWHHAIANIYSRNLDPVLTSEDYVKRCFIYHAQRADYALIEGVMGLFDGINWRPEGSGLTPATNYASTAHIAQLLQQPILLVIDCAKLSGSVAAIVVGYRSLNPDLKLAGVILNKVGSDRHLDLLKQALKPLSIQILGVIRRKQYLALPERYLGLVLPGELSNPPTQWQALAHLATHCFDWPRLLPQLSSPKRPTIPLNLNHSLVKSVKVAIAKDDAFNFYYSDNLDLLEALGAELCPWSPLHDKYLPPHTQGIYIGGGYPELFAGSLSENHSGIASLRHAIEKQIPVFAECGGLIYLSQGLTDAQGTYHPLVASLPIQTSMQSSLTLGYRQVFAQPQQRSWFRASDILTAHEFHRSQTPTPPAQPLFKTQTLHHPARTHYLGWQSDTLHASYLHFHFGSSPQIWGRFLEQCARSERLC
ncbi:MAG: cobyrinate a,c-diamide synthase [Cyanobacteria bacterium P01_H01_bin.15]